MTMVIPLGWQVEDANGNPYAGAKAYFYATGTSTPQDTYSNAALSTPNANPLVADAAGRFGPAYGPTTTDYKVVLKDSSDNTIATYDPVQMTGTPGAGSIGTSQIDADAVTNDKLANMATDRIKGRTTAATGDPEDLSLTEVLDMVGTVARGDVLFRGASDWSRLAAPSAPSRLTHPGGTADPAWKRYAICLFNATGTPAFRGTPVGFASITDSGTGNLKPNFTTNMPSANYAYSVTGELTSGNSEANYHGTPAVDGVTVAISAQNSGDTAIATVDPAYVSVIVEEQ